MADVFGRLAQRALGAAGAKPAGLTPRAPARFEPPPPQPDPEQLPESTPPSAPTEVVHHHRHSTSVERRQERVHTDRELIVRHDSERVTEREKVIVPQALPEQAPSVATPVGVVTPFVQRRDSDPRPERVRPVVPPVPAPRVPIKKEEVHISIGRIEVKAPPESPAIQPPAPIVVSPAPPAVTGEQGLSLSDYLRGNDGRPR